MAIHTTKGIKIFYSYAQEDEKLCNDLDKHIAALRRQGLTSWFDHKISPGTERTVEIDAQLQKAHIILLLISSDFIASSNCYDREMQYALQRHRVGKARVIPIMLRPVDLRETPFEGLEALPKNKKPITKWTDKDEAFVDIVQGIRCVIEDMAKHGPVDEGNLDKKTISAAFATHAQRLESFSLPSTPPTSSLRIDFKRKLITGYDLERVMEEFKRPLDYGKAFPFVVAGDERVLREYVVERMVQEFKEEIQGECFTTPPINLNQQDLSSYPLQSLLEEKIKYRFKYNHARELVMKHSQEHVILTVWNYELPISTMQEAITSFWKSFVPTISRYLCRKKLCFVLILAHLPSENQPWSMQDVTSLELPDFDVKRGIRPFLHRKLHSLNVPEKTRDFCLDQLQDDLYNPVQILRQMEYIADYLQGKYDGGRLSEEKVPARRRSVQK